jgi:pSer/pThr/pTyr-binding forkhead associated (FHA) protein
MATSGDPRRQGNDRTPDDATGDATSSFRADFRGELDDAAAATAEAGAWEAERLPSGSALVAVKRGPHAGLRFLLYQPCVSIGRHPDSDIFLDDVTVSRRHAEFRKENDEFRIVDIGSLNGTYVNSKPVDSVVLANGDQIQIGRSTLVFLTGPATD